MATPRCSQLRPLSSLRRRRGRVGGPNRGQISILQLRAIGLAAAELGIIAANFFVLFLAPI